MKAAKWMRTTKDAEVQRFYKLKQDESAYQAYVRDRWKLLKQRMRFETDLLADSDLPARFKLDFTESHIRTHKRLQMNYDPQHTYLSKAEKKEMQMDESKLSPLKAKLTEKRVGSISALASPRASNGQIQILPSLVTSNLVPSDENFELVQPADVADMDDERQDSNDPNGIFILNIDYYMTRQTTTLCCWTMRVPPFSKLTAKALLMDQRQKRARIKFCGLWTRMIAFITRSTAVECWLSISTVIHILACRLGLFYRGNSRLWRRECVLY